MSEQSKAQDLARARVPADEGKLTTNQGVAVGDNQNSLKAGPRGPTLMEDFILREKITSFDHERIPERVVHARGHGAHGVFQVYESMAEYSSAAFLQDPAARTPVFVRFSTVAGSRGSADTPRDVRGFATKFYTDEGIFDLVGNNIPVFFIQDATKFPDLIHAVKPEPNNEIPQAASAHDTFYDFIGLTPESMHMLMWVMSDRALPRSTRMMDGFGVNTYRLVNAAGKARLVKFHWRTTLGAHSLLWDESQKLAGKDPDFLRRDLWEAIEAGSYPEYELGVQLIEEADQLNFPFDPLDPTKIWPEALVPLRRIGKMTLNRNPDNFFAETEQVAFHVGHVVPGIDFSNDPLLQGRLFSYLDTQLIRLGGPNFAELPINRPTSPVRNNQRDGYMRHAVHAGRISYQPNTLGGGCPMQGGAAGYVSFPEPIEASKVRERSPSFADHFSQATMFWNSQSAAEKEHIVQALSFELGKVTVAEIRRRMVDLLAQVHADLAAPVAGAIGVADPATTGGAEGALARLRADWERYGATAVPGERPANAPTEAPEVSLERTVKGSAATRRVALLGADGVDAGQLSALQGALTAAGAVPEVVSTRVGQITAADGSAIPVEKSVLTMASVMYDGVVVPGGAASVEALRASGDAVHFVAEAFKHCKPIAAVGAGVDLLSAAGLPVGARAKGRVGVEQGVVTGGEGADPAAVGERLVEALGQHRFFGRPGVAGVSA